VAAAIRPGCWRRLDARDGREARAAHKAPRNGRSGCPQGARAAAARDYVAAAGGDAVGADADDGWVRFGEDSNELLCRGGGAGDRGSAPRRLLASARARARARRRPLARGARRLSMRFICPGTRAPFNAHCSLTLYQALSLLAWPEREPRSCRNSVANG
jgi:hypothetical protein